MKCLLDKVFVLLNLHNRSVSNTPIHQYTNTPILYFNNIYWDTTNDKRI
ncbi:MAG TPA: hypothetical protein PLE30_00325 [Candidatus Kapabacteria bacterium]|nr:hypothetical protein [Candidatus Kapabacteria bacterium]